MAQDYFDQLHEAVKQAESRGQRFDEKGKLLTSHKGAEGEMQVMPKTARKPGFGVEPAKDKSPDEIARVGKDYLKAMVDKYGDTEKALVAYNWGPKNADDWLASGADKSKLPKETQGYITRVFNNLNATPPSKTPATAEPTASEKMMVPALQSGMTAKADIKSLAQEAGPGYKAAMAMMFLADDKPDDDKTDIWKEAQPEAPDLMAPSSLADLSLEYKSPFPEKKPVRMAGGGEAKKMLDELPNFEDTSEAPFDMIKGASKMAVEDKQIENMMLGLGTSSSSLGLNLSKMKQGEKENLAQNLMAAYRTKVGDTDVSVMGMRPSGAPAGTYMGNVSAAIPVYGNDRMIVGVNGMQSPYQSGMTGVNLGYSGQVGPGRLDAMMMQPVNSSQGRNFQVQYRLPVGRAEGSPMGGENVDHLTPQEIERMAMVQSPAFMTPSSGRGRQAGNISKALASGEAYPAIARGVAELPYDLVGGPVDLATMAMRPFGYDEKKPVMGSDFIKEKMTKYGIRPGEEANPTLQGFRTAGELGASLINPAAPVRAAVQTAEKVGGKAAEMMGAFRKTKEAPTPEFQNAVETEMARLNQSRQYPRDYTLPADPFMGVAPTVEEARAAVTARQAPETLPSAVPEVAPVAPPVQPGVPAEFPIVGRLDTYVSELKSPVQKQQFINQVKNKFRDYDVERVQEALVDFGDKDKLQPEQIKAALDKLYSPSSLRVEERALGSGGLWDTSDNVYQQPMGAVNLYINQPPEIAARAKQVNELETGLNALYNGTLDPKQIPELKKVVDSHELVSTLPSAKAVSDALTHVEKSYTSIAGAKKELRDISNGFLWPVLYTENGKAPFWDLANAAEIEILRSKGVQINPVHPAYDHTVARGKLPLMERNELERQGRIAATKEVIKRANERAVKLGASPVDTRYLDFSMVDKPYDIIRESPALKHEVESTLEPIELQVHEGLTRIKRYLEKNSQFGEELSPHRLYEGQHPTVTPGGHPVGFARFTEHTVDVPGYGTLEGRHIHDFQSDLAQDVRSKGPKGGNLEKDKLEYEKLSQEQNAAMREPPENMPDADKKKLALEMAKRDKRISELGHRIRSPKTNYSLEQPFAGFETRPAVEQQLMMKTSIQAAMRAGKNFVTFPGGESMQPALYEKIPNNLRQVVKDMGAEGMQIRLIDLPPTTREIKNAKGEITHPLGQPVTAIGLVWGPEAAARIMKTGVPFAKGGSVDKSNTDYRAYI
jgi:hypothetical protein